MKVEVEFEETSIIYYKIEIEVDEEPIEEGCRNCPNGLEKETCTCIDRYDEDIREKIKDKIYESYDNKVKIESMDQEIEIVNIIKV